MEEDRVEALIHSYMPLVYKTARRMCPWDPEDEDLLQCGLIGLWRAAEKWDGARPFTPLAAACVRNEMATHMRRKNRQPATVPLDQVEEELLWEDDLSAVELQADTRRLYRQGSREQALALAVLDGCSLPQAARRLGIRPARARHMARRIGRNLGHFTKT